MTDNPEVRFQQTPDGLVVWARGTMNVTWFLALAAQAAQVVLDAPTKSVLMDIREVVGSLSDMDRYDLGVGGASLGIRVPFAVVGMEPLIEPERLGEIVARNRGMNVRAFTDYEAARTWLREQRTQEESA